MTIESSLLDSGERLLWSGRPEPSRFALRKGWMFALFGVPFLAFALFWTYTASKGAGPMELFGLPFIAVGLSVVAAPVWYFLRGTQTTYVLTPRRTITNTAGMFGSRTSVPLDQIRFVELRQASSRFGDVLFVEILSSQYQNWPNRRDGFIAVPDAASVERLLRQAIDKARPQPGERP